MFVSHSDLWSMPRATTGLCMRSDPRRPGGISGGPHWVKVRPRALYGVASEKNESPTCTGDELHYVSVPNSDWTLALWRYLPSPQSQVSCFVFLRNIYMFFYYYLVCTMYLNYMYGENNKNKNRESREGTIRCCCCQELPPMLLDMISLLRSVFSFFFLFIRVPCKLQCNTINFSSLVLIPFCSFLFLFLCFWRWVFFFFFFNYLDCKQKIVGKKSKYSKDSQNT